MHYFVLLSDRRTEQLYTEHSIHCLKRVSYVCIILLLVILSYLIYIYIYIYIYNVTKSWVYNLNNVSLIIKL